MNNLLPFAWQVVLAVFFRDAALYDRVARFIDAVATITSRSNQPPDVKLVLTKETIMQPMDAKKVLNSDDYNKYLDAGWFL